MIAACGRALRLGADRLKKFLDTTGRSLDLNSNQSLPSAVRCAIASAASPRSRPSPCCCEGGRVENAPTWRRQVQNRYSSTMRACKLLIVRELGWRRGWDSNPITSCRFCNLQTPCCRGCHKCQRCRGALHPIAPEGPYRMNAQAGLNLAHESAALGRVGQAHGHGRDRGARRQGVPGRTHHRSQRPTAEPSI